MGGKRGCLAEGSGKGRRKGRTFDITMDDALFVEETQRDEHLANDQRGVLFLDRSALHL